jgi:hypothetical protein
VGECGFAQGSQDGETYEVRPTDHQLSGETIGEHAADEHAGDQSYGLGTDHEGDPAEAAPF